MNPALLLAISSFNKKQLYFVLVSLAVIVALPFMAVFALGTSALSLLFASSSSTNVGLYQGPLVAGDYYAWGNCTYWVFYLRKQAKEPIPTTWGNAATWAFYAKLDGYLVDHTPSVGSIMQTAAVDHGLGHVAYVTKVNPISGAWTVSQMNVLGLDIVNLQTYPASAATNFYFIHNKLNINSKVGL